MKFCQYILVPRHGYCFLWQFNCIIQLITIQLIVLLLKDNLLGPLPIRKVSFESYFASKKIYRSWTTYRTKLFSTPEKVVTCQRLSSLRGGFVAVLDLFSGAGGPKGPPPPLQSQKFSWRSMRGNSLEKCAICSHHGRYYAHIATAYYISRPLYHKILRPFNTLG